MRLTDQGDTDQFLFWYESLPPQRFTNDSSSSPHWLFQFSEGHGPRDTSEGHLSSLCSFGNNQYYDLFGLPYIWGPLTIIRGSLVALGMFATFVCMSSTYRHKYFVSYSFIITTLTLSSSYRLVYVSTRCQALSIIQPTRGNHISHYRLMPWHPWFIDLLSMSFSF